jgi:hypothetical protein
MATDTTPDLAAATVLRAATRLRDRTRDGGVASVSTGLGDLTAALRLAAKACDDAALRVVPRGDSLGGRYSRAASAWPVVPPPTRERFAALLAALHDAGSTARQAAARCDDAKELLDSALPPPLRAQRTAVAADTDSARHDRARVAADGRQRR